MRDRFRLPALLSFPLAAILAVCAAGGIAIPAVYAREHPHWAAQGLGQDWADLLFAAPLLAVAAYRTLGRSRVFTLVLAGTLAYTLYSLVLYAFFMHFGPLFLAYSVGHRAGLLCVRHPHRRPARGLGEDRGSHGRAGRVRGRKPRHMERIPGPSGYARMFLM